MPDNKFRYTNEQCPICNEHFKNDDDIAVCPYCGTPHHRECYKSNSICANHEKHGEGFRWEPTFVYQDSLQPSTSATEVNNSYNQKNNTNQLSFETPLPPFQVNPLNSLPPELEDGIKTEDVAIFVRQEALKYIKKFQQIKDGKLTWNWAAFFFAPYWFFYRKLHKLGIIMLTIFLLLSSLSFLPPAVRFADAVYSLNTQMEEITDSIETEEEYQSAMIELTDEMAKTFKENTTGFAIMVFQSVASFLVTVFIGLNANKWYYKHTVSQIKKITSENENNDYKSLLFSNGGVSYGAAMLSVLAERTVLLALEMILSGIVQ